MNERIYEAGILPDLLPSIFKALGDLLHAKGGEVGMSLNRAASRGCRWFLFGAFILDSERREVLNAGGIPLPLTPRLFNALEMFVARPGELIEKDDLMQSLWPGRVVEENSLSQVVHGLRRALGEDSEGRGYIQTEPRRGYRLIVPVTRADPAILGSSALTAQPSAGSTLAVLPFSRWPRSPCSRRSKWGWLTA